MKTKRPSATAIISTLGCKLISSTVGTDDNLLLSQSEERAFGDVLSTTPYFVQDTSTVASLVATQYCADLMPLYPAGTTAYDPMPFPGFILQIVGSDLDRPVGNNFDITWTFASTAHGPAPFTQKATFTLTKPSSEGTLIGIIPALTLAGKVRLALPRLLRLAGAGTPIDKITIAGLSSLMTAQVRILTHHDGGFPLLWPQLDELLNGDR